jgi:hypothetical protein
METYLQHRDAYHDKGEEETDTDYHAIPYANGQDSRHTASLSRDCARGDAGKTPGWWRQTNENYP